MISEDVLNYINGEWVSSYSTQSVPVINPANEETLAQCPLGTSSDVNRAVIAARDAFRSWRQVPAIDRVQPLFRLKGLMEENLDSLARQVTLENGKTLSEARGSVRRGIQMLETACGIPSLMLGDCSEDIASGIDCYAIKRPLGVFAGIAPFNFPAMVPFWFWPFAVACGNTFILKPSERVPLTQIKIFELIARSGLPKGVMNLVHGGKEVVETLCAHPDVQGISFVGSTPVAKQIYTQASAAGKRVQALGGAKNFMVVLPDAVMDQSAKTAVESIIGCAGERCLAGSVIINVGEGTYTQVKEKVLERVADTSVGDGLDPNVQMGPLISREAKNRVLQLIESALEEGAELLVDGRSIDSLRAQGSRGFFLGPTVLGNTTSEMKIAREEVFGPVILLAKAFSLSEAIAWINSSEYGNTTTLFTTHGAAARQFAYEVDPSMIGINIGVPAPMAFFSFGGTKQSFFGDIKAHGKSCIDFFTDTKVTIQRWVEDSSIW